MNFLLKIVGSLLLYSLMAGCIKQDIDVIPEHVDQLENLTIHATNTEPPSQLQIEKEQTFGTTNEDVFIGWLQAVAVDEAGRVYMADRDELDVKVYQPDGNFQSIIGKEGDGPGEFRSINTIKTISNQIVVLDEIRQLIQWFSLDNHDLQNSVQLEISDNMEVARVSDFFVINDQTFLLQFSKMISRSERMRHYSLMDHSEELINDKFLEHPDSDIFSDNTDGFAIAMVLPFAEKPLVAVSKKSGIYKAWNNDFLVKEYNYEGEYTRAFYYPFENEELVRRDVLDRYNERFRRAIQNADFPELWPALNDMLIDDENRLWVSTIVEDFDIYEWWVLEETGELITTFEWPRDEPIEVVKNGKMYTRETDEETGLQQVVRYRVEFGES